MVKSVKKKKERPPLKLVIMPVLDKYKEHEGKNEEELKGVIEG